MPLDIGVVDAAVILTKIWHTEKLLLQTHPAVDCYTKYQESVVQLASFRNTFNSLLFGEHQFLNLIWDGCVRKLFSVRNLQ